MLTNALSFAAGSLTDVALSAGRAVALGVGGGLGAIGAGVGIGLVFKGVLDAMVRQPAMREEITGVQWLAFALTEACFFYGLVAGMLAYVL